MAETDLNEPTVIDRDTMLVGLTAIGIRLYADSGEVLADSILAAERVVFARQFDPIWCELTNDDHRWLREKLDEEDDGDGAFGRMVADYEGLSDEVCVVGVTDSACVPGQDRREAVGVAAVCWA